MLADVGVVENPFWLVQKYPRLSYTFGSHEHFSFTSYAYFSEWLWPNPGAYGVWRWHRYLRYTQVQTFNGDWSKGVVRGLEGESSREDISLNDAGMYPKDLCNLEGAVMDSADFWYNL